MAPAVVFISALLSILSLLSQGYVIDRSCDLYGPDVVQGIPRAMADSRSMAKLAMNAIIQGPDPEDNTRSRMFYAADPATDATQLAQARGQTRPLHAQLFINLI
jgi:hypothetical protein